MCRGHTKEYYSALQSNAILICVTTGMSLDNIMLSEKAVPKGRLWEIPRRDTCIEVGSRLEVTRDWGQGTLGSYCLVGTEFLFEAVPVSLLGLQNRVP